MKRGISGSLKTRQKKQYANNSNIIRRLLKFDAIILFIIPVLFYFLNYWYFYGYFTYYQIPKEFISLNIIRIINFSAFAIPWILIISAFSFVIYKIFILSKGTAILTIIGFFILPFAYMYYIVVCQKKVNYAWNTIFSISLLIIPVMLILIWIIRRRLSSYKENNIHLLLPLLMPEQYLLILMIYGCFILGLFFGGAYEASHQTGFYIMNSNPECVILHMTSEKALCFIFDRKTKEVGKSFSVMAIGNDPNLKLLKEQIGPLKIPLDVP
jgi:hypothetical protein